MTRLLSTQPDDPGHHHDRDPIINNYAPLRFEASGPGREVAMLGAIRIGELLPQIGRRTVCVLFRLPDAPRTMFTCSSIMAAKRKCTEQTLEWIQAAGLRT